MRAAVLHGARDLRIEDVAEAVIAPGQVRVRVAYSGICGSDLHAFLDPDSLGLDFHTPHPLTGGMFPQILGHELSGTVTEVADDVSSVAVGDRVAVWPIYWCGECSSCRRGNLHACRRLAFHGLSSIGGGIAASTTVPAGMIHRLLPEVDLRLGALVEPMAVGWHAVRRSLIAPGSRALVVGAGPIGLGTVFALRANGVDSIVVSEPSVARRSVVEELGIATVVDPTAADLAEAVLADCDGVDAAFDTAGAPAGVEEALGVLGQNGTLVVVANHAAPLSIDLRRLVVGEAAITGSLAYTHDDFDEVIAAMAAGAYDLTGGWVSEIGMDEIVATMNELHHGRGMKVLVRCDPVRVAPDEVQES